MVTKGSTGTTKIIAKNLRHAVQNTSPQNPIEIRVIVESETAQIRKMTKSILYNTRELPPLQQTSSMVWNTTAKILRAAWRHRHRGVILMLGPSVGLFCHSVLTLMQIYVATSIALSTFVTPRDKMSDMTVMSLKVIIACMRFLRRVLELPIDIPVFLVKIAHGHLVTRREAQQVLKKARAELNNAPLEP